MLYANLKAWICWWRRSWQVSKGTRTLITWYLHNGSWESGLGNVRVGFPGKLTWHPDCSCGSLWGSSDNPHSQRMLRIQGCAEGEAQQQQCCPSRTSGPVVTLQSYQDLGLDSGPSGVCTKVIGYRLSLETGLTLGKALYHWFKILEWVESWKLQVKSLSTIWGMDSSILMVDLSIYN